MNSVAHPACIRFHHHCCPSCSNNPNIVSLLYGNITRASYYLYILHDTPCHHSNIRCFRYLLGASTTSPTTPELKIARDVVYTITESCRLLPEFQ